MSIMGNNIVKGREGEDLEMKLTNDNTLTILTSLKTTIPLVFRMIFSNPLYIAIAAAVFTTFWIVFKCLISCYFFTYSNFLSTLMM